MIPSGGGPGAQAGRFPQNYGAAYECRCQYHDALHQGMGDIP